MPILKKYVKINKKEFCMKKITIDESKCIHCGKCISDCITSCIDFNENNIPYMKHEESCISCQHCLAICPTGALTYNDKNPDNSEPTDYNSILGLIKSRKSIRQYKQEEIDAETWDKLKTMLPYIPTGCNSHALHFSIIETKSAMDTIRNNVNEKIKKLLSSKALSPITQKFGPYKDAFMNGYDIIFRNAPHMVVVSSPINAPCAREDGIIALSYLELYAQHLKLGTCWCGLAHFCIKFMPEISEMLEIPTGYTPIYAILLGKPDVEYPRTTQPEAYKINSIKEVKKENSCICCKIKRFFTNILPR